MHYDTYLFIVVRNINATRGSKAMNTETNDIEFTDNYITAWSTTDDATREKLVTTLYVSDADFYAEEPGDGPVERHGRAEIAENIRQVNLRLVQGKGLVTEKTGFSRNHDIVKVVWKMSTPDGVIMMTGMNMLKCGADGMIVRDYIFIG